MNSEKLRREGKHLNCTETQEAEVVQYITLHGHSQWTRRHNEAPSRALSSIHAGPGQQVFGSSRNQRCDLMLSFHRSPENVSRPALLFYHNYHGSLFHYEGHSPVCPRSTDSARHRDFQMNKGMVDSNLAEQFLILKDTEEFDCFRREYAVAMTMVRPDECVFQYSTSLTCDYYHGSVVHYRPADQLGKPADNFIEGVGRMPDQPVRAAIFQSTPAARRRTPSTSSSSSTSASPRTARRGNQQQKQQQQQQQQQKLNPAPTVDDTLHAAMFNGTLTALLQSEFFKAKNIYFRKQEDYITHACFLRGLKSGVFKGFVTLTGGCEHVSGDANDYFGFCIQKYAPNPGLGEISGFTRCQIATYNGWNLNTPAGAKLVDNYLMSQPARTLNSGVFHSEETISTTYLNWLMKERNFSGFNVTHFIRYNFADQSKPFLEPILQTRHECKQRGEKVAAECLKLIGNGCFGFNGLEAINYDETRLITGERLKAIRATSMAHLTLKHITMIGVVRMKVGAKKKRKKQQAKNEDSLRNIKAGFDARQFLSDEAGVYDDDEDNADDNGDNENDDDDDDDDADVRNLEDAAEDDDVVVAGLRHRQLKQSKRKRKRRNTMSDVESDFDELKDLNYSSGDDDVSSSDSSDSSVNRLVIDTSDGGGGDLDELLIREAESAVDRAVCDHDYLIVPTASTSRRKISREERKRRTHLVHSERRYKYHFLFAVTVSGVTKKIKNCLPRAVAILSNSKKLFLSHIHVMLECLNPGLTEICYIDTDSVIFSSTLASLSDCVLPEKLETWKFHDIIADEAGAVSCHGKMKCEGVFAAGKFRALKVYRLYGSPVEARQAGESEQQVQAVYTRSKGINRWLASQLSDEAFDSSYLDKVTVHRTALRPNRTGEILMVHESRSMTTPFNLKRLVDTASNGLHTYPLSFGVPHITHEEADDIVIAMNKT
jgi:hypothetical protein